jgi:hypothetical protein
LEACSETSVERARTSYVCPLFKEVSEAVYLARWNMMQQFGERVALRALILVPPNQQKEMQDDGLPVATNQGYSSGPTKG